MENLISENKIDLYLATYKRYCDRVNYYNKNVIKLKEKCESILNSYNFKLTKKCSSMIFNDLEEYIKGIDDLLKIIKIPICENYNDITQLTISYSQWFSISDHEDIYIKYFKKLEKFNKSPSAYNTYALNFIATELEEYASKKIIEELHNNSDIYLCGFELNNINI